MATKLSSKVITLSMVKDMPLPTEHKAFLAEILYSNGFEFKEITLELFYSMYHAMNYGMLVARENQ